MGRVERQFQGVVLQLIHEIIGENPTLPFDTFPLQEEGRSDILLREKGTLKGITVIELKDPEATDGATPYYHSLVGDAEGYAAKQGCPYFVTWNIQDAVLWDRTKPDVPLYVSDIAHLTFLTPKETRYFKNTKFAHESFKDKVKRGLLAMLFTISGLLAGKAPSLRELDEKFIDRIRALIAGYLYPIANDVQTAYKTDNGLKTQVIGWVVKGQYWTWEETDESLPEEIERLTRLALLFLLNKLIFYKAMQASGTWPTLPNLSMSPDIRDKRRAAEYIWREYFDLVVREIDYETVFGERKSILDELPFLSKSVLDFLKEFMAQASLYDFSCLPKDIIGRIFERLIREEERHKMGQYFTRPDVVDFINAFCIKTGDEVVLDPGTGSGTFLVNAYYRKQALKAQSHWKILSELYGLDIAPYPAHLATLNLAIRDLRLKKNYPKILRSDMFAVRPRLTRHKFRTPEGEEIEGLLPKVDVVVGNPPYTRQEEMEEIFEGTKDKAWDLVEREWGYEISKRSGIYVYFFYHAAEFLKDGGRLGFVTSDAWLDVNYGKYLQRFFLEHFKIIAIIDSKVERWFTDALVNTAITIIQRCPNEKEKTNHIVKFVYLKKPLPEVVTELTSDGFSKIIEEAQEPQETELFRIFTITQEDLWRDALDEKGNFIGSKWTKFLKAPKVYWKILERGKDKLCRLGSIADVRRGFTSGANEFFYVQDVTDSYGEKDLKLKFRLDNKLDLRVIIAGDGSIHQIEKEFLKSVITSPKEISRLTVKPQDLDLKVVLIPKEKKELKGKKALEYITWGEGKGRAFHKRTTCESRPRWYDLGEREHWPILFPMIHYFRHVITINDIKAQVDHNLFEIKPHEKAFTTSIFCSLLSSFACLIKEFESRRYGGGALKTEGIDIVRQLVVNPAKMGKAWIRQAKALIKKMARRDFSKIFNEVNEPDRRELDNFILETLGFTNPKERAQVLEELYQGLVDIVKSRGEKARSVEKEEKKRRATDVLAMAAQIAIVVKEEAPEPKPNYASLDLIQGTIKDRTANRKLRKLLEEAVWIELFGEGVPMPGHQMTF